MESEILFELPEEKRMGLDIESIPRPSWYGDVRWKHVTCIGIGGIEPEWQEWQEYFVNRDRRPGLWSRRDLAALRGFFEEENLVVVGHNVAKHDLAAVNGLFIEHRVAPLPVLR